MAVLYLSKNPGAAAATLLGNNAVSPGTLSKNGAAIKLIYAGGY